MISGIGSAPAHAAAYARALPPGRDDDCCRDPDTAGLVAAEDRAEFSSEALRLAAEGGPEETAGSRTPDEEREVEELRQRDLEVRAHEAAHMAAGGSHVRGGATFSYQIGPDGRSYAVGGEVSVDTSPVPNNPGATIAKMQQIRAAALAPGDPSSNDQAVAASAAQKEVEARAELQERYASKVVGAYAQPEAGSPRGQMVDASA